MPDPNNPLESTIRQIAGALTTPSFPLTAGQYAEIRAALINFRNQEEQLWKQKQEVNTQE